MNKKINQLSTRTAVGTDLALVGDPSTGTSYKTTFAELPLVPYTGATGAVNLGAYDLTVNGLTVGKGNGSLAFNTVSGVQAGLSFTSATASTAIGYNSLKLHSTGNWNTAIGYLSMAQDVDGIGNTAIGTTTLANLTTGANTGNTAIGINSLNRLTSGSYNTQIGYGIVTSGILTSGSYNTLIGAQINVGVASLSNNIILADGQGNIRFRDDATSTILSRLQGTGTRIVLSDTNGALSTTPTGDTTQYVAGDGSLVAFPIAGQSGTLVREVRNVTGATLTKGTVVYINGASGNKPTVTKALATGDATSAQTFGIIQADISNNSNGYVVAVGDLDGLNTSAFADGDQLYLSSTVAGAYTTTKQYAPNHLVYIGVVTRSHPTQGRIEVRIQNGYEMDELHNVSAQSPANNDGLFWNSSTNLWSKNTIGGVLGYTPQAALTLTTTGTSGAATLVGATLNIPQYSGTNIYNASGTLTSARALTLGGFTLDFIGSTHTNRFTAAGRLLLGTTSESTYLLDVNGTARVSGALTVTGSTTAASAIARGANYTPTLVASANNDVTVGLDVTPTFTNGAFTGVTNIGLRFTATGGNPYAIYATGGNSRSFFSGTLAVGIDSQVGSSIMRVGGQLAARAFTDDEGYGTRLEKNFLNLYSGSVVLTGATSGGGLSIYSGTADTTVGAGVLLSLNSTTKGFRPPRVTTTQKNAISPVAGLMVYDTTLNKLCVYTTAWETITSI